MCESLGKKLKKNMVKMPTFLVCTYNSQDFAQIQENLARSHVRETVTFRNSVQPVQQACFFIFTIDSHLIPLIRQKAPNSSKKYQKLPIH